jgi:hypothetical protein
VCIDVFIDTDYSSIICMVNENRKTTVRFHCSLKDKISSVYCARTVSCTCVCIRSGAEGSLSICTSLCLKINDEPYPVLPSHYTYSILETVFSNIISLSGTIMECDDFVPL